MSKLKMVREDRLGMFKVNKTMIESADPAKMRELFGPLLIVACYYSEAYNEYVYKAYCEEFEPVQEGHLLPIYRVQINAVYNSTGAIDKVSIDWIEEK